MACCLTAPSHYLKLCHFSTNSSLLSFVCMLYPARQIVTKAELSSMNTVIRMTSSDGNIFGLSGLLCGVFTGHQRIPLTKASEVELWCFLWSAPEPTVEQTIETLVIWDAITRCHHAHYDVTVMIADSMIHYWVFLALTHWDRVTHISVSKQTIIGSDNGLSPCRRQAIIWTNAGLLLIGPLGTNFSELLIEIPTFSFKKMHLKMSSAKRRPFCFGLNVLTHCSLETPNSMIELHPNWFM